MKPIKKIIAVLVIFGILIGAAWAQFSKPEKAVKYRQSVMFVIGQHFGRLGAMVKGQQPYDQKSFASNTAVIKALGSFPGRRFWSPAATRAKRP